MPGPGARARKQEKTHLKPQQVVHSVFLCFLVKRGRGSASQQNDALKGDGSSRSGMSEACDATRTQSRFATHLHCGSPLAFMVKSAAIGSRNGSGSTPAVESEMIMARSAEHGGTGPSPAEREGPRCCGWGRDARTGERVVFTCAACTREKQSHFIASKTVVVTGSEGRVESLLREGGD